jgi:DNA modification methylase
VAPHPINLLGASSLEDRRSRQCQHEESRFRRTARYLVTSRSSNCLRSHLISTNVFDDAVISEDREKAYHDYQQPVSESVFFIKALTRPRAVICDPFLGSGTTACAVTRLGQGRRFWGAEIDHDTCKIARSRVAELLRSLGGEKTSAAKVATR